MSYTKINFNENGAKIQCNKSQLKKWITQISITHNYKITNLSYTFCTDEYLLNINQEYLNHDTFTDIITFDLRDEQNNNTIEGDIYISLDRIKENAITHNSSYKTELLRVIIHGLLHLCNFKDKKKKEKVEMRKMEELAIETFFAMFHVK
jgi:rRNA maturation RNase YbeY